ncbi:hypothetical protein LHJ74_19530 [Streptomyces sp. N2-109]|uniref:Uncharacterized protein n=1 Tax=Streptomyces gossypii TaxID=2883101 RepID=A0ABT2JW54_9ACTN|nr:hypothetical protein [Streptomyces gossypii]MCT2592066.1 hypothetical protein [Streptomyces gossypii]
MGVGLRSAILDFVGDEGEGPGGGPGSRGPGSDLGGMKSDRELWTSASEGVNSLHQSLKRATAQLDEQQAGLGAGTAPVTGLTSGTAQLAAYRSWERYLRLLGRECAELTGKLHKAGNDHYKNDQATGHAFAEQLTRPEHPRRGGDRGW